MRWFMAVGQPSAWLWYLGRTESEALRREVRGQSTTWSTKMRLPKVSPAAWPGREHHGPRHPALACVLGSVRQQARGSLSISATLEHNVWHHHHQCHCVSGQTATKPKQAEQPAC